MIVDRFGKGHYLQSDGEDRLIRLIDFGNSSEKIFVYAQSILSAEKWIKERNPRLVDDMPNTFARNS